MVVVAAWVGFGAYMAYFIVEVWIHLQPTGYRSLVHTVSDDVHGPYGAWARGALVINGVGSLLLLFALAMLVGVPPLTGESLVALGIVGTTRLLMLFVTTDAPGRPRTCRGTFHSVLAVLNFAAAVTMMSTMTRETVGITGAVHGLLLLVARAAVPLLAAFVVTIILPRLETLVGLSERLFLLAVNIWLLVMAAWAAGWGAGLWR